MPDQEMASQNQTIILGADHAGFALKSIVKTYLEQQGYPLVDVGCYSEDSVDYPLIAEQFAEAFEQQQKKVEKTPLALGVIICGSGVGVAIGVNRFAHIRAVLAHEETTARLSRQHNDANVLCFGARMVAPELALEVLNVWLKTDFDGLRHSKRVQQLGEIGKTPAC